MLLLLLAVPARALEDLPELPPEAEEHLVQTDRGFLPDLADMLTGALRELLPEVREVAGLCASVLAVAILCGLFPNSGTKGAHLAGTAAILMLLLGRWDRLIRRAVLTAGELGDYGGLLIPVMTGAMAASGGVSRAAGLYLGVAFFHSLLLRLAQQVLLPGIYMLLALTAACAAFGETLLVRLRDFLKTVLTWGLKGILYAFSACMALTGVISGQADAASLKAAKLAISTAVPVVGGILSEAAQTLLLGADAVRSAAGVAGLMAVLAMVLTPFFRTGIYYLFMKFTAALCALVGSKEHTGLLEGCGQAMGLVLGILASEALLWIIGIACFMKGVS